MKVSLTVFKNLYDRETANSISLKSFDEFEAMLYHLSTIKGYKPKKGEYPKFSSPLISPAVYNGGTRSNVNVAEWGGWAALDVDNYAVVDTLQKDMTKAHSTKFVCYSTASSTPEKPKFRLVFPLSRSVSNTEIQHFWYALNIENGLVGDKQTKDLSRMFYVPAVYPGAFNFIFSNELTNPIDVDDLLKKHSFITPVVSNSFIDRLPPDLQRAVVASRAMKLKSENKKDYTWSGYDDCPFVNKNLVDEYKSIAYRDGSGRYSMIYKFLTSTACSAVKHNYPITEYELATLAQQLDRDTSNRYQKRPLSLEAGRAIEFAYRNV